MELEFSTLFSALAELAWQPAPAELVDAIDVAPPSTLATILTPAAAAAIAAVAGQPEIAAELEGGTAVLMHKGEDGTELQAYPNVAGDGGSVFGVSLCLYVSVAG